MCKRLRRLFPLLVLGALGVLPLQAAPLVIPPVPLHANISPSPNVLFLLDDSGSMQMEYLRIAEDTNLFLFPYPQGVYGPGSADYWFRTREANPLAPGVIAFDGNDVGNLLFRSVSNNPQYYDPALEYQPGVDHLGNPLPDAVPSAASYNPYLAGSAVLNLTAAQTVNANWITVSTFVEQNGVAVPTLVYRNESRTYYPLNFLVYKGSGATTAISSYDRYEYRGSAFYKNGLAVSSLPFGRSPAAELQNFANWFSYHRSRILSVRTGVSRAFAALGPNYRVGFSTINTDHVSVPISLPTTPFLGTTRQSFYSQLFGAAIPRKQTPLRTALKAAGEHYKTDVPWGPTPRLSCRQSFTILTTDGYWNDASPEVGNQDDQPGLDNTSADGKTSYSYAPAPPHEDDFSDTLADVAMKYWKNDLRGDLINDVPVGSNNPAFWQHMSTFALSLGLRGTLNPVTDLGALTTGTKVWPDPTTGEAAKLDDLWHATINGHGAFVSAANPTEFERGLTQVLGRIADRVGSASSVAGNSSSLDTGAQVFQARFASGQWSGELLAYPISSAGGVGSLPLWRATTELSKKPWSTRNIVSWNGSAQISFTYSGLSAAQQTALGSAQVVDYLRGDPSQELRNGGSFRNRSGTVLGDIVNSSPYYSKDINTVFVGANDGMLHAFDAASGAERFAYVPAAVIGSGLKTLTDPYYAHRYFVDGEIAVSTRRQTAGGRNYLVAALGRGGKGVFALDVTDPASPVVKWEHTSGEDLGLILGKPVIARLNDGSDVAIFGNGYNSTNENAVLYIVNLASGEIRTIRTSDDSSNGLGTPKGWDADGNGTIDIVYAADLRGNVWKFDLGAADSAGWKLAYKLFQARDAAGKEQPITGGIGLGINSVVGHPSYGKLYLFFGTGRYLTYRVTATGVETDATDNSVQTWYGLIDNPPLEVVSPLITSRSELKARTITSQTLLSGKTVRTFSSATQGDMAGKKGWYIDLLTPPGGLAEGERMIGDTAQFAGTLIASSIIPSTGNDCFPSGRGFVNAIDPFTGGNLSQLFFDVNGDGFFDAADMVAGQPVGSVDLGIGMPGNPVIIGDRLVVGGSSGEMASMQIRSTLQNRRLSWREVQR